MNIRMLWMLILLILPVCMCTAYAQHNDSAKSDLLAGQHMLIAKGVSGLEYNVAEIIKEHFAAKGCVVEVVDIKAFSKADPVRHKAVLLLSAVRSNKMPRYVRKGMNRIDALEETAQPLVFISTLAGENWLERESEVDAVTGSSEKVNAQAIADKIIFRLEEMLDSRKN